MTTKTQLQIGDKVRLATTASAGETVAYTATVRKIDGTTVWVEIPAKVRRLRFPPYNGHRYVQFAISTLVR